MSLKNKSEHVQIAKQRAYMKRREGTRNNIGTIRENLGMRGPIQVESCPAASPCRHDDPECISTDSLSSSLEHIDEGSVSTDSASLSLDDIALQDQTAALAPRASSQINHTSSVTCCNLNSMIDTPISYHNIRIIGFSDLAFHGTIDAYPWRQYTQHSRYSTNRSISYTPRATQDYNQIVYIEFCRLVMMLWVFSYLRQTG